MRAFHVVRSAVGSAPGGATKPVAVAAADRRLSQAWIGTPTGLANVAGPSRPFGRSESARAVHRPRAQPAASASGRPAGLVHGTVVPAGVTTRLRSIAS